MLLTVAAGMLHVTLQALVAAAVAFTPNASLFGSTTTATPMPEPLSLRGARSLRTEVGPSVALSSWLLEPKHSPTKGTVVLLHGIRMDKRSLVPLSVALSDAGYRVVLLDLRGHGESTGRFLTYGALEAQDVSRLLNELTGNGIQLGAVGVYGFSYGGAVALEVGARDARVRAVVAAAPFSTLNEVVNDYRLRYLPAPFQLVPGWWFRNAVQHAASLAAFDAEAAGPRESIGRSHGNILLLHGDADTQVPLRHSQTLMRMANGRANLVVLPGATHETIPADPSGAIGKQTVAWFDRWLASSAG